MRNRRKVVFFDVETTGVNVVSDRIVSIALIIWNEDGTRDEHDFLVNPTIPIPREASDVHGILDEQVADCQKFIEVAPKIFDLFKGADIAGYNSNHFDVPILAEEFERCGISFMSEKRRFFDAYKVFAKMEKRDLTAAYKRYCGKEMVGAHDAGNDIRATAEILDAQIKEYPELADADALHEFCEYGDRADFTGNLIYTDGVLTYNFGKNKGRPVSSDKGYANWMLDNDFSLVTKALLRKELT
jgi:DNA polymerase-3 subunit epsilon